MPNIEEDWVLQKSYREDPEKAFHILGTHLFQPDKLSKLIITAIDSQVDLKKALYAISNEGRKQFWTDIFLSKTSFSLITLGALALAGVHFNWWLTIIKMIAK